VLPQPSSELLAYARDAIDRLGYIRPEFDGTIAVLLEQSRSRGPAAAADWYHAVGEQISLQEKQALGLGSTTRFSRNALDALTERGRMYALRAHLLTLEHALRRVRWQDACKAAHDQGTDRLKIMGPHRDCRGCLGLSGKHIASSDTTLLPPAECDLELCQIILQPWPEWLP
jgi:hypothetical protein